MQRKFTSKGRKSLIYLAKNKYYNTHQSITSKKGCTGESLSVDQLYYTRNRESIIYYNYVSTFIIEDSLRFSFPVDT